ncbi:MAG: LysR family transcriptional regulator [Hyphomicrobiaceae bacterium]|nr:LysR family transcriptional regulator [Hyphomicrobiaceae bacterium]
MKISPYQIAAFSYAAREHSFSRAAEAMGVTQSAVTQHVAKLEQVMGTSLFVRRRGGLELTPAGKELFALSDRIRTLEQLVAEKIESYSSLSTGHLSIVANAPRPAMPLIAAYNRLYPKVEVSFSLHSWTVVMEKLAAREVDVAIITDPPASEDLFRLELMAHKFVLIAHRGHPILKSSRLRLRDLADMPLVLPEDGSLTQRIVLAKARQLGVGLNKVVKMNSYPVVKEAVLHGVGIGIVLEHSFFPDPKLVEHRIVDLSETFRTCLVAPMDKRDLRFVRSFVEVAETEGSH